MKVLPQNTQKHRENFSVSVSSVAIVAIVGGSKELPSEEVCDATGDAICTNAWLQKKILEAVLKTWKPVAILK